MIPSLRFVAALAALLPALACGGTGSSGAGAALPAGTSYLTGNLEPMIVDWQPEQRGDLETSLRDGVAVVAYDDRGLRLLRDCHVDGAYDYLGMTRRERVVRLRSLDDVRANLPLGGLGLAAQLGGELQHGSTLDIAMVMVGKLRTTWKRVAPKDLVGTCEGATHFVRGATVGAFAVDRGDGTQARSVAEIFGVGVGGGHASSSSIHVVDGQLERCAGATPESARAPSQCGALIRVEFGEIRPETAAAVELDTRDTCVAPLVRVDGACTRATAAVARTAECTFGDAPACRRSCAAGNTTSCWKIARMLYLGNGTAKAPAESFGIAEEACAAQEPKACTLLGILQEEGAGTPKDKRAAVASYQHACDLGDADGCGNGGQMLVFGDGVPVDNRRGTALLGYGCKGGNNTACDALGISALGMKGAHQDLVGAARLFKRACDGDNASACGNFGALADFGLGVARDEKAALAAYQKACDLDGSMCSSLAAAVELGRVKGGPAAKVELYRRACSRGSNFACSYLQIYVDGSPVAKGEDFTKDLAGKRELCDLGLPRTCGMAGVMLLRDGRRDEGRALLDRGCKLHDDWACFAVRYRTLR